MYCSASCGHTHPCCVLHAARVVTPHSTSNGVQKSPSSVYKSPFSASPSKAGLNMGLETRQFSTNRVHIFNLPSDFLICFADFFI